MQKKKEINNLHGNVLGGFDIVVVVAYFLLVLITSLSTTFFFKKKGVSGYFLAGQQITWLPVGASLFASNIGSEHFIGLAGSGAASGIGIGSFELNACLFLQVLGWVFLPVYISSGVMTLPEYMQKRFGGKRIRIYLAVLSLLLYVFSKISVNLYSGSLFIKVALGWNIWISILLILLLTAVVTITGGLAAVIYTDAVQAVIMVVGSIILTVMGFVQIGGVQALFDKYPLAVSNATRFGLDNHSCASLSPYSFRLLRPITDKDMPWLGFLLGQSAASVWYWCADQMMVQRALSAKSLSHAQGGVLLAGFIKLLPLFFMVIPGMISRILFPDVIACSDPDVCESICGSRSGCTNLAYPQLVMNILPTGLRGLMMSVMLAALITDLTSIFNSSSTIFTMDIYKKIKPQASSRQLLLLGRGFILIMVVVSVAWVPVITSLQGAELYIYIQDMVANLAPPIAMVFLLAVIWKRGNELGAFSALCYGFCLGCIRFVLTLFYSQPACGDLDQRPEWVHWMPHYMYFAMFSSFSSCLVMIIVSLCSEKPTQNMLENTILWDINRTGVDKALNDTQEDNQETYTLQEQSDKESTENLKPQMSIRLRIYNMLVSADADDCTDAKSTKLAVLRSVHQSRNVKITLNMLLVLLLVLTACIYIVMSFIPPMIEPFSYKLHGI